MDLDEPTPNKDGGHHNSDDWDRMDTEEAVGGDNWGLKYQTLLEVLIRYGQELKHEFKDDQSKHVKDTFTDIFSMFSYPDPRKSPQGKLLESEQRVPVAESLNSAILGKFPSLPSVQPIYKDAKIADNSRSLSGQVILNSTGTRVQTNGRAGGHDQRRWRTGLFHQCTQLAAVE